MNYSKNIASIVMGLTLVAATGCQSKTTAKPAIKTATVAGCEIITDDNTMVTLQQTLLSQSPDISNPPVYDFSAGKPLIADMTIKYRQANLAGCPTSLRNYAGAKYDGRPVGPTMLIKPGQQYVGMIDNQLPKPPGMQRMQSHGGESTRSGYVAPDGAHAMGHNIRIGTAANDIHRYKFNITNLHTHGWHVWPTENHDNIFAEIHPGDEPYLQQVELPDDHVAGTFWYHAHVHGSTTIQVASGMVGTLIVTDKDKGLDAIEQIAKATDRVFIFQQLAYGEDGKIENYNNLQQGNYKKLNRPIFVNGQAYPTVSISPNEVQRWRFIHGGITDGIKPMIIKDYKSDTATTNKASFKMNEIALDGLPTGTMPKIDYADLAPGYRVDVLAQLNGATPGDTYYLVDQAQCAYKQGSGSNNCDKNTAMPNLRRILAKIVISPTQSNNNHLPSNAAITQAKQDYVYGDYKPEAADPFRGMGPLNDITDIQLTGKTQLVHFFATNTYKCPEEGGSCTPCPIDTTGTLTKCADPQDFSQDVTSKNASYMVCDGKMPVQYIDDNGNTQTKDVWSCFNFNSSTDYALSLIHI